MLPYPSLEADPLIGHLCCSERKLSQKAESTSSSYVFASISEKKSLQRTTAAENYDTNNQSGFLHAQRKNLFLYSVSSFIFKTESGKLCQHYLIRAGPGKDDSIGLFVC